MSRVTSVNLSDLPVPAAIETLSFEAILAEMKADAISRAPELAAALELESDLLAKAFEVCAYRELLARARANDQIRAVMLATATGADLDGLVALFGVARLVLVPADLDATPPVPAQLETDAALRRRAQLSLDGYSTAGARHSYEFHALSASPMVADVHVDSPAAGVVRVTVLAADGDGTAAPALLDDVSAALNDEDVRPLCSALVVQTVGIVPFEIAAQLTVQQGPDREVVLAAAAAELARYLADLRAIGRSVRRSAIYAALHRPGVDAVALLAPTADIEITTNQTAHCVLVDITGVVA